MSNHSHIVCPACNAVNRVPHERLTESPKCGKCHVVMFQQKSLSLTEDTFFKHIERSDVPVLVDFWAPWCGPCKRMGPDFERATAELEPWVRTAKVNTEANQSLSAQFNIRSIPTLAIFKGGQEIARNPGAMLARDIVRWTKQYL